MIRSPVLLAFSAAGAAFGATGAALAMMGAGLPFLPATAVMSGCAGLAIYAVARRTSARPEPALPAPAIPEPALPGTSSNDGVLPASEASEAGETAEARSRALRHDLRGALSPAMMVADRLTGHADPAVKKAGETILKSIERAIALISASKGPAAPARHDAAP